MSTEKSGFIWSPADFLSFLLPILSVCWICVISLLDFLFSYYGYPEVMPLICLELICFLAGNHFVNLECWGDDVYYVVAV